ncbi:NF-kappa-B inhibitor cactus [Prorops nasuta]|uniref:NF-kappa-B inhibitor cactus n=1 Tax=Prorops nasuta TaxID=863751 RepID=UPI0034CF99CD
MEENVAGKCQKQQESSHIDSGFMSGSNLQFSSEIVPEESNVVVQERMRDDSLVDLGLSESLSNLTLKKVNLNPLSIEVESEPIYKLATLNSKCEDDSKIREHILSRLTDEPWQLYYAQDDEGDTQLHIAIVQGLVEAAISLIRMAPHSCLLNITNDDKHSPLHLAVLTRQPRIVRDLVLAGVTLALRNFRGNTALHLACAIGDLACARALTEPLSPIERNNLQHTPGKKVPALPQNLEQRNYNGEMCLHIASSGGHVDLVRLLLRMGADLEAREALSGKNALHLAVEQNRRSVVTFLLQECRPCLDAPTYAGLTAYQLALCLDRQLARELVRLGATPKPLPESESESESEPENASESDPETDVSKDKDSKYLPGINRLCQNTVQLRA